MPEVCNSNFPGLVDQAAGHEYRGDQMSTVAEKIKEAEFLCYKDDWDGTIKLLKEITGANPQQKLAMANVRAWLERGSCSLEKAYSIWKAIIKKENCAKHTLVSAHVGLCTHHAGYRENKKALEYAKGTLFFPPKEVTIKDTCDLGKCAAYLMERIDSEQAKILFEEALELNKILLDKKEYSNNFEIMGAIHEQMSKNCKNLEILTKR